MFISALSPHLRRLQHGEKHLFLTSPVACNVFLYATSLLVMVFIMPPRLYFGGRHNYGDEHGWRKMALSVMRLLTSVAALFSFVWLQNLCGGRHAALLCFKRMSPPPTPAASCIRAFSSPAAAGFYRAMLLRAVYTQRWRDDSASVPCYTTAKWSPRIVSVYARALRLARTCILQEVPFAAPLAFTAAPVQILLYPCGLVHLSRRGLFPLHHPGAGFSRALFWLLRRSC